MFLATKDKQHNVIYKGLVTLVVTAFISTSLIPPQKSYAQALNLPQPGSMVKITNDFQPAVITGIKIDPNNPLLFDFLIDPGQVPLNDTQRNVEYKKLIKYFLAALTTPEHDMWVNLSPYEHHRMIADDLSKTEMGRDMLAQDYVLKQLSASLIYPEESLGKKFWDAVYERVRMETGSAQIPVNTFNKVWILPDKASIFEKGNVAMVVSSHMRVLMDQDYLSLNKHANADKNVSHATSDVMREIVLPAIEKEVNEGKNFANIRQIYNSIILASWFKQRIKMHLLSKIYVNKNENAGVELKTPQDNDRIYKNYLRAFKLGAFNYIKEDLDPVSGETLPRKYFSGGLTYAMMANKIGTSSAMLTITNNPGRLAMKALVNVRVLLAVVGASVALSGTAAFASGNSSSTDNQYANLTPAAMQQMLQDDRNESSNLRSFIFSTKHGQADWSRIQSTKKQLGNLATEELALQKAIASSTSTTVTPAPSVDQIPAPSAVTTTPTPEQPAVTGLTSPTVHTPALSQANQKATDNFKNGIVTENGLKVTIVHGDHTTTLIPHVFGSHPTTPGHPEDGGHVYSHSGGDKITDTFVPGSEWPNLQVSTPKWYSGFGIDGDFTLNNPTNTPIGSTVVVHLKGQQVGTGTLAGMGEFASDKPVVILANVTGDVKGGFFSPNDGYTFTTAEEGQAAAPATFTTATSSPTLPTQIGTVNHFLDHPDSIPGDSRVKNLNTHEEFPHVVKTVQTPDHNVTVYAFEKDGTIGTHTISSTDWPNTQVGTRGIWGSFWSKYGDQYIDNSSTNADFGKIAYFYAPVPGNHDGAQNESARGLIIAQGSISVGGDPGYDLYGYYLARIPGDPLSKFSGFMPFNGNELALGQHAENPVKNLTSSVIDPQYVDFFHFLNGDGTKKNPGIKGKPTPDQITAITEAIKDAPENIQKLAKDFTNATSNKKAKKAKRLLVEALRTIQLVPQTEASTETPETPQTSTVASTSAGIPTVNVPGISADDLETTAKVKANPLNASDLTITVVSTNGTIRVITHAFDPTPTTNGDMEVPSYNHGTFSMDYISADDWQTNTIIHEKGFWGGLFSNFPFVAQNDPTNNQVGNIAILYKKAKGTNGTSGVEVELARGIDGGLLETEDGAEGLALIGSPNIPHSVSGFYTFTGQDIAYVPAGSPMPEGLTETIIDPNLLPLHNIINPIKGTPDQNQKDAITAELAKLSSVPQAVTTLVDQYLVATNRHDARTIKSQLLESLRTTILAPPNLTGPATPPAPTVEVPPAVIPPTQTPVMPEITNLTAGVTYPMNLGTIQLPDRSIGNVVNYSLDPNGPFVLVNSVDTQSGTFHSMPYYLTDEVPLDQWPAAKLTDTHPANDAFQVPEIDPNLPKLNVNDDIWVYPTKDQSAFKGRVVKIFMEHGQYYVHALDHLNRTHKIPLTAGSYRKSLLTDPPTDTVDDHTSPTLQSSAASNTSTNLGEALTTGGESDVTSLTNTVTAWSTLNFELDGSSIKRVMYVKPDNRDLSKAKSVVVHSVIGGFWSRAFGPLELESHIIPIDVWNAGVTQVKPNWFKSIFHDNDVDELPLYGTIYGQDPQGYPNVHRGKQFKYFDNTKSGHGDVVVQGEIYRITSDGDNVRVHVKSPDGKDGWVVLDETSAYSYLVGDNLDDLKRNPIIARYPGMVLTPGKTPGSVHLGYASQPVNTTIATPAVNPESIVFPLKKKQWVSIDGGAPVQVIKQYRNEVTKKGVVQIVFDAWVKGITVGPNELARVKYTVPPSSIKIVPAPAPVLASGASVPAINITGFVFNPDVQAAIDKFNVFANGNPQVTPDDIMQLNQALNNYQTAINQKNIGKISPKRLKRFHDGVMKLFEEKTSVGGIDFDAKYLQLNLQGDATNIPVPQGFQWLLNTPIRGFNPKIIDIHSGIGYTLSFFKGLLTPGQEQSAKADLPKPMAVDHRLAMKNWAAEEV